MSFSQEELSFEKAAKRFFLRHGSRGAKPSMTAAPKKPKE
jgi:hypothetical protein